MSEGKDTRRPLTPEESEAVWALHGVTFPVASWDKRFSRQLNKDSHITERGAAQIWRLFIKYRRQINRDLFARLHKMAERLAAPDFRKQQAASNEQAKIDKLKAEYARQMAEKTTP